MMLDTLNTFNSMNENEMLEVDGGLIVTAGTLLLAKAVGVKKIKGGVVQVALVVDGVIIGWRAAS